MAAGSHQLLRSSSQHGQVLLPRKDQSPIDHDAALSMQRGGTGLMPSIPPCSPPCRPICRAQSTSIGSTRLAPSCLPCSRRGMGTTAIFLSLKVQGQTARKTVNSLKDMLPTLDMGSSTMQSTGQEELVTGIVQSLVGSHLHLSMALQALLLLREAC